MSYESPASSPKNYQGEGHRHHEFRWSKIGRPYAGWFELTGRAVWMGTTIFC
jgi:hypothetical protein